MQESRMRWGIGGVALAGAMILGAGQAGAQAGPDLAVKKAEIASLDGQRVRLNVFLSKPGAGQASEAVKVFWVQGNNRTEIHSGQGRFAGGRDGMQNQLNVQLPANIGQGHIEIVAGLKEKDPNFADNVAKIMLSGGDLVFDGRPTIKQNVGGTPNRELVLTVRNNGPSGIPPGCKVEIQLAERGPAKKIEQALPALARGAKHVLRAVPFHFVSSPTRDHNTLRASIICPQDPVGGNNAYAGRLQ